MQSVLLLTKAELKNLQPTRVEVTSEEDKVDYDELYSILFYTSVWVCRNTFSHFRKGDQIHLLLLLSKNMSELGKKVSTEVLVKLAEDSDSLQTLLVDVVCL
jgi:hypothetical protein